MSSTIVLVSYPFGCFLTKKIAKTHFGIYIIPHCRNLAKFIDVLKIIYLIYYSDGAISLPYGITPNFIKIAQNITYL